jgi:hypothetical protein
MVATSRLVSARQSLDERRRAFQERREVWQAWRKDFLLWQAGFLKRQLFAAQAEVDKAERQQLTLGLGVLRLLDGSDGSNVR